MAGTLTITTPSTDSASGYSTTSINIVWSFTGSPVSTVQSSRRVTWQQTGSSSLVGDTTMQASTATSYTVTGLSSGVSYDVWVYVLDSAGATTSAKRVVVSNYTRSLPPTLNFSTDLTESVFIAVTNPTDASSRPTVTTNTIYRRTTGSTGDWTLVGTTGNNQTLPDRSLLRSNTSYDYFARTDSGAESIVYTTVSPQVTGFWMHDPNNMDATQRHFPFGEGNAESVGVEEQMLAFVGRAYPIVETGVGESQTIAISCVIPFYDTDWRTQVEWWRARKRGRTTLLYRDGRGRAHAGRLYGDVSINPSRSGAQVACTFVRVDYTQQTTTIPASQYNQGSANDGGNGVGGNGINGNGY